MQCRKTASRFRDIKRENRVARVPRIVAPRRPASTLERPVNQMEKSYEVMNVEGGRHVKMWTRGVPVDDQARAQLANIARMPFVHSHLAVMPDVHVGKGATVGSVIATRGAIIPAAVGVDIGCGMMAVRTTLKAEDLPESLAPLRSRIERAVPHGMVSVPGRASRGAWAVTPDSVRSRWAGLARRHDAIVARYPKLSAKEPHRQLGTLGGGNHFIEICLDGEQAVWVMLHSGSRGIGNLIGQLFIELARKDMKKHFINLPDQDLAYLVEGTAHFDDYFDAMTWAQDYAAENRRAMMDSVLRVMRDELRPFQLGEVAVNCHHNYCTRETHFGEDVIVTRKGAVSARKGELGIIPGSMGARSYIVHRSRPRQRRKLPELLAWGGPSDVANRGAEALHGRGSHCRDRGRGVSQGPACHRRNTGRVQGHRRGDGGAARSRGSRVYPEAGALREGLSERSARFHFGLRPARSSAPAHRRRFTPPVPARYRARAGDTLPLASPCGTSRGNPG